MSYRIKGLDGTVSIPAWTFASDADSGFYRIGADNMGLALGGVKRWDFAAAGSTLTGTLTVSGDVTAQAGLAVTANATVGGTLGVTGAATLSSTLGVAGDASFSSAVRILGGSLRIDVPDGTSTGQRLQVTTEADRVIANLTWTAGNAPHLDIQTGGTTRARLTGGSTPGVLCIGTTFTTGASAGDAVLAHGNYLRGVTGGGTAVRIIGGVATIGATTTIVLGGSDSPSGLGNPGTVSGAANGDVVLGHGKYLRGVNVAGTGTSALIANSAISGNDVVAINPSAVGVTTNGAVTSVGSSLAGDFILANNRSVRGVNAAGTSTIVIGKIDTSGYPQLGDGSIHTKLGYISSAGLASAGSTSNGVVVLDSTNNRLVFYVGGNRYYVTGTAF